MQMNLNLLSERIISIELELSLIEIEMIHRILSVPINSKFKSDDEKKLILGLVEFFKELLDE